MMGPYSSKTTQFHGAQHALACLLHLEAQAGAVGETHRGNRVRLAPLFSEIFFPWHRKLLKMSGNLKKVQVQQSIEHRYQGESKSTESKQF